MEGCFMHPLPRQSESDANEFGGLCTQLRFHPLKHGGLCHFKCIDFVCNKHPDMNHGRQPCLKWLFIYSPHPMSQFIKNGRDPVDSIHDGLSYL